MVTKQYNVNFCASDFLLLKIELAKIHFARLNKYRPPPPPFPSPTNILRQFLARLAT